MRERPQGLRPWARRVPLWALPTVGRAFMLLLLPAYVALAVWRGLAEWLGEFMDPF